jgi:hypothetical protein
MIDADKLRQAAAVASNAADELRQARQRVLSLVDHAVNNNFTVSPTYQVTDNSGSHNADSIARQAWALQTSTDLVRYAGELWTHDADTAGRMAQAVDLQTGDGEGHKTIHVTPYPGDLMTHDRENPPPSVPGKAGAWRDMWTPYGDNLSPHDRLEHCGPDREGEDLTRVSLGVAGVSSGNAILGIIGSTMGIEGGLKDVFKCEPPGGVH